MSEKTEMPDRLYIQRKNKDPSETSFAIHFPHIVGDVQTSMGATVTLTADQFKELTEHIESIMAWTCPRCGKALRNYNSPKFGWNYKICEYCGWKEKGYDD